MRAFYATEDDASILREVIQDYRRRNRGSEGSPSVNHPLSLGEMPGYPSDDIFPPEVYIAEIPESGIPAMTADTVGTGTDLHYTPGWAGCTICRLWPRTDQTGTAEVIETYFTEIVYNLSTTAIERSGNDIYCLVKRDKYGHWFAETKAVSSSEPLVELCAQETATRNTVYDALLGTWDTTLHKWCYDGAETVKAIDHREGSPYAELGWKGLYQAMSSAIYGTIYVCVSLDCSLPAEQCSCTGTGT